MEGHTFPIQVGSERGQQTRTSQGEQPAVFEAAISYSSHEVLPAHHTQVPHHHLYQQSPYNGFVEEPSQTSPATCTGIFHESAHLEPGTIHPQISFVPSSGGSPGLNFNGYRLEPSANPIPEEFIRIPTGTSIAEPGSILDEESGRTYYNHNTGKYFFPNDAVSKVTV